MNPDMGLQEQVAGVVSTMLNASRLRLMIGRSLV